jgi:hypothetical protein
VRRAVEESRVEFRVTLLGVTRAVNDPNELFAVTLIAPEKPSTAEKVRVAFPVCPV